MFSVLVVWSASVVDSQALWSNLTTMIRVYLMLVMTIIAKCRSCTLLMGCTQGSESACMCLSAYPVSPYTHEQQHQVQSSMLSSISAVCGKMTLHTNAVPWVLAVINQLWLLRPKRRLPPCSCNWVGSICSSRPGRAVHLQRPYSQRLPCTASRKLQPGCKPLVRTHLSPVLSLLSLHVLVDWDIGCSMQQQHQRFACKVSFTNCLQTVRSQSK